MRGHFVGLIAVGVLCACGRTELVRYSIERPDAGADAGQPDAGAPDAGCRPRPLPVEAALPTVLFVIDRSGSMADDLDGQPDAGVGQSRWALLAQSLAQVLPPLDARIAMGALIYPLPDLSCAVPSQVDLSPAVNQSSALLRLLRSTEPLGGTPTHDALEAAAAHLRALRTATSARALVLATDGAPNCNFTLDERSCVCTAPPTQNPNCDAPTHCLDADDTVSRLNALFLTERVPTYVIGLGSALNQFASTLDAMAVAGGVPRMGAGERYYSATNQAELTAAFTRVTAQLTRCTYLLSSHRVGEALEVRVNGQLIPPGAAGWQWLDESKGELVINGAPCDQITAGAQPEVQVRCD